MACLYPCLLQNIDCWQTHKFKSNQESVSHSDDDRYEDSADESDNEVEGGDNGLEHAPVYRMRRSDRARGAHDSYGANHGLTVLNGWQPAHTDAESSRLLQQWFSSCAAANLRRCLREYLGMWYPDATVTKLSAYSTFTIKLRGRDPFQLSKLLPSPSSCSESVAAMKAALARPTQPSVRPSLWINMGDHVPLASGEVLAAVRLDAMQGGKACTHDALVIHYHDFATERSVQKSSRVVDGVDEVFDEGSAILGGGVVALPADAYHAYAPYDVVGLSDSIGVVGLDSVVSVADVIPCFVPGSVNVRKSLAPGVTRPPLLRAYWRV